MNKPILLVEDDENDVFFMKRALKLAGVTKPLEVASNGRLAIDYLREAVRTGESRAPNSFPFPCLVLLDLNLPEVMGFDVLKWIREQPDLKTLIVVVLTSSNLPQDINKAYRLSANSYLVKPPSPAELPEIVTMIKRYWLELNQAPPLRKDIESRVDIHHSFPLAARATFPKQDSARHNQISSLATQALGEKLVQNPLGM